MEEKITLDFGKKKISVNATIISGFKRFIGLMFSRKEKAKILLFKFSRPVKLSIHSLFVFFPFIAIWIDDRGKIIEIKKIKPFLLHICPSKKFLSFVVFCPDFIFHLSCFIRRTR